MNDISSSLIAARSELARADARYKARAREYANSVAGNLDSLPCLANLRLDPLLASSVAEEVAETARECVAGLNQLRAEIEANVEPSPDRELALAVIDRRLALWGG